MASSARNTSILSSGNNAPFAGTTSSTIRDYSNLSDTVDLSGNTITNYHTRMLDGDDNVTLSNIVAGSIWSNKINGNAGRDTITSKVGSLTRDFIQGGSEGDTIDLSNSIRGADWQNGNRGNDTIVGANSTTMSVLRGGSEDDSIRINTGTKHIAVGDLGKDTITDFGTGRIVLRTDGDNAALNPNQADVIVGFAPGFTKMYIPGVATKADLNAVDVGGKTYITASKFTNGTTGLRYIACFDARSVAVVNTYIASAIDSTVGTIADAALAALNPTTFRNDSNLGNLFD